MFLSVRPYRCICILYLSFIQCGYSNPTQSEIINDLGLTISEVWPWSFYIFFVRFSLYLHCSFVCKFIFLWVVLSFWFSSKCGCHGWCNSQWSDLRVHWSERGRIFSLNTSDFIAFTSLLWCFHCLLVVDNCYRIETMNDVCCWNAVINDCFYP